MFVGKTNLHEFAFGTTSEDSAFGPARHPLDDRRSPGGSSGGSAAAVRTGMSVASVGTDTGGSIRIPAAACGVVGLKPGWSEVAAEGVVPLSRQLDHVGPLTRNVADAALLFDVLRGLPPREHLVPAPEARSLTLGLLGGYFMDRLGDDVEAGIAAAIDGLRRDGMKVGEQSVAHAHDIAAVYLHLVLADAAAYHASSLERSGRTHYTHNVRIRLEMGRAHPGRRLSSARCAGAWCSQREVDQALHGVDALVLPALAIEAPPIGAASVPVKGGSEPVRSAMLRCTQLFNITGHPAIALPCGTTRTGLPVGLQLVGPCRTDAGLLASPRAVEHSLLTR